MKKPDIQQVYQVGSFLLCVSLALQIESGLEGGEFSGGWLTGPLLSMEDIGITLFIVAVALTFVFPRVAAATGLASSLLSLPLYLFFIAPVPFAQVFARGHEFKVQPASGFHWHMWLARIIREDIASPVIGVKWVVNPDRWGLVEQRSKGIEEFQHRDVQVAGWRDRGAVTIVGVEFG